MYVPNHGVIKTSFCFFVSENVVFLKNVWRVRLSVYKELGTDLDQGRLGWPSGTPKASGSAPHAAAWGCGLYRGRTEGRTDGAAVAMRDCGWMVGSGLCSWLNSPRRKLYQKIIIITLKRDYLSRHTPL